MRHARIPRPALPVDVALATYACLSVAAIRDAAKKFAGTAIVAARRDERLLGNQWNRVYLIIETLGDRNLVR